MDLARSERILVRSIDLASSDELLEGESSPCPSPLAPRHFFTSTGTLSIFAARMKSFSDNPPMACVHNSIATSR